MTATLRCLAMYSAFTAPKSIVITLMSLRPTARVAATTLSALLSQGA
ncbi:hypothetical protein [Vibrio cholerae]|nr:hypothetical protein [Vibrio cholerae]MCD6731941.1 hypothetical protein [Vibrio cholerae]